MTPVFPGKVTIPRIAYTYGGNNDEEEEEGTFSGVRGYGDVEVEAVVETLKEYYIRTAPHGMDWVIVLSSSILACVLPFILWRKN